MTLRVHSREEEAIRRSERLQLAALFETNIDTLTGYCKDGRSLIELICLLLRMNTIELSDQQIPENNSQIENEDGR